MNERQRIEELNDHARRCFRAERDYAVSDARACELHQQACQAFDETRRLNAERSKLWAVYQAQFVRFVQDCVHEDPARSASLAEVLSWFTPKERETDPDGREIIR